MPGRGHALTIDSGWRDIADKALAVVKLHLAELSRRAGRWGQVHG
jgi:hypothetical protein